jgi:threonine dehydrogenase-like Zn-dependent dehydrogenase
MIWNSWFCSCAQAWRYPKTDASRKLRTKAHEEKSGLSDAHGSLPWSGLCLRCRLFHERKHPMKALVYKGPRDVAINDMPDAKIEQPTDVLVKITTTNICGSDLHMYEGRTSVETGKILGHENLGVVIETGKAVQQIKVGDRVCLPFNIACGHCENCERGLTGFCLTANPGSVGAAYGYAEMGPYSGGQAELLRVPYADFNCLLLPPDAVEKENDYVMLSDIFPTGYHATELAGMKPGDSVVIFGAGPVGLMAAHSAMIKGASKVMVVDMHKDRLALAEKIGAIPIDNADASCAEQILSLTGGMGADCGCECVGYQCHDHPGHEVPNLTMNNLVKSVKATGGIGVVGVFMPEDPGGADDMAKQGQIAFDFGQFFTKGQRMGTGQANVKAYNRKLMRLIEQGRAKPSFIVSHELPLEKAVEGYANFDARKEGWTKVVLKAGA